MAASHDMATPIALRSFGGTGRILGRLLRRDAHTKTKCRANFAQLSPIPWLERAALLAPARTAVKYGDDMTMTYAELMVSLVVLVGENDTGLL